MLGVLRSYSHGPDPGGSGGERAPAMDLADLTVLG